MSENAVLNIFQTFDLSDIDGEWVESMISSEFTEEPGIELDLSPSLSGYIQDCNDAMRQYATSASCTSGNTRCTLLNELVKTGISSKMIQSWLYYLFHQGLKITANFEQKQLSILGADLYFLLLKLPGVSSSELHHAILFEKAVNSFFMATQAGDGNNGSAGGRKRKSNLPMSQSQKRRKHSGENTAGNAEDNEEHVEITAKQAAVIHNHLTLVLGDFCKYAVTVSLRANEVSLKHSIRVLVKIANYLRTNCPISFVDYTLFKADGSAVDLLKVPYQLVIYGLFLMISTKHGDLDQLCMTLFRFILPIITMRDANAPSSTVPRAFYQNSEIFRRLVCHLYDVHGDIILPSLRVLTQNLIAQCPDRTDFRNHVSTIVSCILSHMPLGFLADFCDWLRRIAVHTKIVYRSNALTLVGRLLCQPERKDDESQSSTDSDAPSPTEHGYLLKIVVGRLMDIAPSIRSRALHVLIEIMEEGIVSESALQQVVNAKNKDLESETPAQTSNGPRRTTTPGTLYSVPASSLMNTSMEDKSTLLQLLGNCAVEPKAMVRKTAVHALEMAIKYGFVNPTSESLGILEAKCRDPSLMVRKQAISSISEVLMHFKDSPHAQASWANGTLPAILDAESSVQEKSALLVESAILNNLDSNEENRGLAWSLLGYFASANGEPLRSYLQTVCRQWKRQMKLDSVLVNKIVSELDNPSRSAGAWLFLKLLTLYVSNKNIANKITESWLVEYKKEHTLMFHVNSVTTMGQICKHLNADTQQKVMDICIQRLKMSQFPIQLISYLVETICNLIEALYKDTEGSSEWPQPLMEWCQNMLKESDEYLYKTITNSSQSDGTFLDEQALIHQLYIAGNVGKHCATKVPKRLTLSLQALLTSTECLANMTQMSSQLSSQDIPLSQPLSQFTHSGGVPQHIRAHAVINLGKICLHNSQLAKKCVPAMVRELDTCENDMVKNNVMIILTDLCVQQTQMVDPYLSDMANCLGDESNSVRKNALLLLSNLLKKEFVKWRGSLIYKFLTMLRDKNQEIQDLVRFSLVNHTLRRNAGDVFFRHFVEAIFYLNAYTGHNVFNRFPKSDRECRLFNFSGEARADDRMFIYSFMLEHMDDEHRIRLTGKLCTDILDGVVDGVIPLKKNSNDVLADALAVLCSQDLKLKCMKANDDEDMEGMQNEAATAANNAIKHKIISHVVMKNLLENVIPIIIALKNTLVAHKSPLVRNVMLCLKEIMKDHKTEVQDILISDKQLAREIEYDLKRFDREQEERLQKEQMPLPPAPGTPISTAQIQATETPPRTPKTVQPQNPKTPAPSVPSPLQQYVATPTRHKENVPATPAPGQFLSPSVALRRKKGLGIAAVLNSATKTMDKLKIGQHNVDMNSNSPSRAISTPARTTALVDLTFSNMTEISAILTPVEPAAGE